MISEGTLLLHGLSTTAVYTLSSLSVIAPWSRRLLYNHSLLYTLWCPSCHSINIFPSWNKVTKPRDDYQLCFVGWGKYFASSRLIEGSFFWLIVMRHVVQANYITWASKALHSPVEIETDFTKRPHLISHQQEIKKRLAVNKSQVFLLELLFTHHQDGWIGYVSARRWWNLAP